MIGDPRPGIGISLQHVDWPSNRRLIDFVPPVGMRIFVNHTPVSADNALGAYLKELEKAGHPVPNSKGQAALYQEILRSPRVVVVDLLMQQGFMAKEQQKRADLIAKKKALEEVMLQQANQVQKGKS
jgi:hypothetical protein